MREIDELQLLSSEIVIKGGTPFDPTDPDASEKFFEDDGQSERALRIHGRILSDESDIHIDDEDLSTWSLEELYAAEKLIGIDLLKNIIQTG